MTSVAELQVFRNRAYGLLGNGRDVLFDLMDSVITSRKLPSFADVSLSPRFRRQWPSLDKTLDRSEPSADKLMRLYTDYLPKGNRLCWQETIRPGHASGHRRLKSVPMSTSQSGLQAQNLSLWGRGIALSYVFQICQAVGHFHWCMSELQVLRVPWRKRPTNSSVYARG